jgi:hypothetical protein
MCENALAGKLCNAQECIGTTVAFLSCCCVSTCVLVCLSQLCSCGFLYVSVRAADPWAALRTVEVPNDFGRRVHVGGLPGISATSFTAVPQHLGGRGMHLHAAIVILTRSIHPRLLVEKPAVPRALTALL